MKGGLVIKKITITDPEDKEKHFHPYTKTWHATGGCGFFVGLGPPPTKGEIAYKDFYCSVNTTGRITNIIIWDTGFFERPAGEVKNYVHGLEWTKISRAFYTRGGTMTKYDNPYDFLDKMLMTNMATGYEEDSPKFGSYYIHKYDNYNPVATITRHPDGFELLTHTVNTEVSSKTGGKRKTRRVKKSNRKSNRKRRSNTKRHTRKH
jgi:hypothetical protein